LRNGVGLTLNRERDAVADGERFKGSVNDALKCDSKHFGTSGRSPMSTRVRVFPKVAKFYNASQKSSATLKNQIPSSSARWRVSFVALKSTLQSSECILTQSK